MPDPDHSRNALTASPASPAPPEGPFWTFWQAVAYVDLRDPKSVRDAPPPPSPRLRQAIAKVKEAIQNRTLRAFEFRDIDGVTEFREVSRRRWLDPTSMIAEGFASLTGDLDLLDKLYDGILLSVADAMAAFPAPDEAAVAAEAVETTEVIETTAPAKKTAPITAVVTTTPFTPKEGKEFYRGQIGVAKNRPAADVAARAFFGPVPNKLLDEAAKAAGFVGEMGRPKKVR